MSLYDILKPLLMVPAFSTELTRTMVESYTILDSNERMFKPLRSSAKIGTSIESARPIAVSGKVILKSFTMIGLVEPEKPKESTTPTVVVPRVRALNNPAVSMDATEGLLDVHVNGALPPLVTLNRSVSPFVNVAEVGEITTVGAVSAVNRPSTVFALRFSLNRTLENVIVVWPEAAGKTLNLT